jgi:glucose/arabinose dehydrogenase
MRYLLTLTLLLGLMACANNTNVSEELPATTKAKSSRWSDPTLILPDNFEAIVVADAVGRARHIAVRDNGDIYIQLQKAKDEKGIAALRDIDGDGRADTLAYFGEHTGTGMEIYKGYLYCSSTTEVFRYPLPEDGALVPDESRRELVVSGFPEQSSHEAKSVTFDNDGHLYVNVGAPSNACMKEARTKGSTGMDPCPQLEWQGGIWQFDAMQAGQTQQANGERFATGLRNCVGIQFNHEGNQLYAMQHGRDQLSYLFPGMYSYEQNAELPSEEFLKVDNGDDFGWPYCYYDHKQDKKVLAPEYGGDGEKQGRCEGIEEPVVAFPGHMAPNDLVFYHSDQYPEKYKEGVFIAFHGSWNRAPLPQKGYFVAFVPMRNGSATGDWEIFVDNIAAETTIEKPKDAKHRPTGLAVGPDGSLYITDSVEGKVWKVRYLG